MFTFPEQGSEIYTHSQRASIRRANDSQRPSTRRRVGIGWYADGGRWRIVSQQYCDCTEGAYFSLLDRTNLISRAVPNLDGWASTRYRTDLVDSNNRVWFLQLRASSLHTVTT